MNNVTMSCKAAQKIAHTLNQSVELGMNEHFRDQIFARVLDQPFPVADLLALQGLDRYRIQFCLQIDVAIEDVP